MGLPTEAALVGAGAVPGAILRFGVSEIAKQHNVGPAAILALNVVGSFALGSLAGNGAARRANLLLGVGFCGAFTTFSTFSVDTLTMLQRGQNSRAAAYVLCSNLLSIGAAAAGHRLTLPPPILRALRPPGG